VECHWGRLLGRPGAVAEEYSAKGPRRSFKGSPEESLWSVRIVGGGKKTIRRPWRHFTICHKSSAWTLLMIEASRAHSDRRSAARAPPSWFHQGTARGEKGRRLYPEACRRLKNLLRSGQGCRGYCTGPGGCGRPSLLLSLAHLERERHGGDQVG
jgi:hypothetical protein